MLVIVVLIVVPPQILCANSETYVLAETEASNSKTWVAVTSEDNTITTYNTLVHNFRHRSTRLYVRKQIYQIQ